MPELVTPHVRYAESYRAAYRELDREPPTDVAAEVANLVDEQWRPEPGKVRCTHLWWVAGEEYLGRIGVRHELDDWLAELGGHIGYDVRPSRRRQGHATAMLAAALPTAHALGIDPALITCDTDNVASRRTIEANGGVFEDERGGKLRYWVATDR
ncbi:GNAT family N-acetyltransferase [Nocardioides mangrovicus]|uniref:GNAT family N-acetyltransferase n=1 Tax=Nocardioides mangrovicus TaxID=2478913 RepID=A0A3L8P2S4_9ACTN|nr:GNAT family N-acetyltransferase [Nocardioides mangrovicus]RLV49605.1 GNAT family N-acetyltransferase [Nocardioides mangrovicus]